MKRWVVLLANDEGQPINADLVTAFRLTVNERNGLVFTDTGGATVAVYGAGRWIRAAEVDGALHPAAIETFEIGRHEVRHGQPGRPRRPWTPPSPTPGQP